MLTSSTQRRTLRVLGFSCVRRSRRSGAESGLGGPGFWRSLGRDFLSVPTLAARSCLGSWSGERGGILPCDLRSPLKESFGAKAAISHSKHVFNGRLSTVIVAR